MKAKCGICLRPGLGVGSEAARVCHWHGMKSGAVSVSKHGVRLRSGWACGLGPSARPAEQGRRHCGMSLASSPPCSGTTKPGGSWLGQDAGAASSGCSRFRVLPAPLQLCGSPFRHCKGDWPQTEPRDTSETKSKKRVFAVFSALAVRGWLLRTRTHIPGTQQFARYGCNLCIFILFPRKGVVMQTMS